MRSISFLLVVASLPLAVEAQNSGKPKPTSPVPRVNGKPDLSGLWEAERTPLAEFSRVLGDDFAKEQTDSNDITKHAIDVFWGLKPEERPLTPAAAGILEQRRKQTSPSTRCLPMGVPASLFIYDFKIVQAPGEIVVLPGDGDPPRQIYVDGRPLPKDPQPSWMGSSVGKWQGDTLSVETTGFSEQSWLDASGNPRSESTHIREIYHRRDFGHMDVEVTIDDPKYYTRPFTFTASFHLVPDSDLFEFVCDENERDRVHTKP